MNTVIVNFLPYLDAILAVGLMIGGILAMRNGRRNALATIQEQTITALQGQIDALSLRIAELEKTNAKQEFIIETMQAAMKQRGFVVSIDGDLVTVTGATGSTSRKRPPPAKESKP